MRAARAAGRGASPLPEQRRRDLHRRLRKEWHRQTHRPLRVHSLVSDYDNDGWPDIYVACDSTPNIFFHNEGDGTFTDVGLISGTAVNEDGQEQAGMEFQPPTMIWTASSIWSRPTSPTTP